MKDTNYTFTYLIAEYEKLKDEQHKRIGFRDNMIFVTLGAIGAVFSFSLENPQYNIALLVLPFICITLGWTYLVNDEKISSIGSYLKKSLIPKISECGKNEKITLESNWEDYLKASTSRKQRKWIQLFVDLFIFCVSGILSLVAFYILREKLNVFYNILLGFEIILLIFLASQFIKYAEIKKKKKANA